MIEGFSQELQNAVTAASLAGDAAIASYLAGMTDTERSQTIATQISHLITQVSDDKQSFYLDNADQVYGADKNVESAMYYLARTKDLKDFASDADEVTMKQLNVIDVNSELSVRQNEINEWSNQNKLDTLFFLQLLFTGLCFIAFVLFLKISGIVTHSVFMMLSVVTGIFIVITLIIRYRFTSVSRDSRYWHKARFPKEADKLKPASTSGSCPS